MSRRSDMRESTQTRGGRNSARSTPFGCSKSLISVSCILAIMAPLGDGTIREIGRVDVLMILPISIESFTNMTYKCSPANRLQRTVAPLGSRTDDGKGSYVREHQLTQQ